MANAASNKSTIKKAILELDGQALTKATVDPALKSVFEFDLGGRLEALPNYEDYEKTDTLWLLYEPSSPVFSLRADGYYRHATGNTPPDDLEWKSLDG